MFQLFLEIFFQLDNSVLIIMFFFFNFILIFFLWRICVHKRYCFESVLNTICMFFPSPCKLPVWGTSQAFLTSHTSTRLWHSRLGHPFFCTTSLFLWVFKLPFTASAMLLPCSTCAHAKAHAIPHLLSPSRSSYAFQLLFMDATPLLSTNSARYYLYILDDYSKQGFKFRTGTGRYGRNFAYQPEDWY